MQTIFPRTLKTMVFAATAAGLLLTGPSAFAADPPSGDAEPPKSEPVPVPSLALPQTSSPTPPVAPVLAQPSAPNTPRVAPPFPPPAVVPPPGFVPYGFGAPPPIPQDAREPPFELPYESGPIPPDYRLRVRPHKAVILAGTALFAGFYSFVALGGLSRPDSNVAPYGTLGIPVVGPFIFVGMANLQNDSALFSAALLVDGVSQAVGIALLVTGVVRKQHVLVRNEVAGAQPELVVGPGLFGMKLRF